MPSNSPAPIPYHPGVEQTLQDEADNDRKLTEAMLDISRTVLHDSGHVRRSVHAKSHGVLHGELEVLEGLPPELAQGMFANPGRHPVIMRLSTTPGDILDDTVSTPRGLALKVLGVQGPRLPGSETDTTQNFVLGNAPSFNVRNATDFLSNISKLGATASKAPALKKMFSAVSRNAEQMLEMAGLQSTTLTTYAGQAMTHILGDSFYSQAPLLYGDYMAKLCVSPVSANLLALSEQNVDLHGQPDGLRTLVRAFFAANTAVWEMRIQLCTDLDTMPIEDASVEWPQDFNPYRTVARIVVQPQDSWQPDMVEAVDEGLTFSPWHGLAAHRPLGSVMRSRRQAYESSARLRGECIGRALSEPGSMSELMIAND